MNKKIVSQEESWLTHAYEHFVDWANVLEKQEDPQETKSMLTVTVVFVVVVAEEDLTLEVDFVFELAHLLDVEYVAID